MTTSACNVQTNHFSRPHSQIHRKSCPSQDSSPLCLGILRCSQPEGPWHRLKRGRKNKPTGFSAWGALAGGAGGRRGLHPWGRAMVLLFSQLYTQAYPGPWQVGGGGGGRGGIDLLGVLSWQLAPDPIISGQASNAVHQGRSQGCFWALPYRRPLDLCKFTSPFPEQGSGVEEGHTYTWFGKSPGLWIILGLTPTGSQIEFYVRDGKISQDTRGTVTFYCVTY